MNNRVQRLVTRANERLAQLGAIVEPGSFVCPTCLRLLPVTFATEGHYPARTAPAVRRRTELQCSECNSRIGATYEGAGIDFMKFVRTVTMSRPGIASPYVRRQGTVRNQDGGVSVELHSRGAKRPGRHARHAHTRLDRVLEGAQVPRTLAVTIERPTDDPAKRAVLAWSFLALFYYAGYRYAASAGAERVRRLILDPNSPLPEGVVYTKGSIRMPLAAPEPVVVVRKENGTPVELVAMGVQWDRLVAVFPFANDHDNRAWGRLSELLAADELVTTDVQRLRSTHDLLRKELNALVEVSDDSGGRRRITAELTLVEIQALAEGVSPRRLDPRAGGGWRTPMTVEHEFLTVEGEPPGRR